MKENIRHKWKSIYIDRRKKYLVNVIGFRVSSHPISMNKIPNFMFEGHDKNKSMVCVIKSLATRKELLIDYNLNRIKETCDYVLCILY